MSECFLEVTNVNVACYTVYQLVHLLLDLSISKFTHLLVLHHNCTIVTIFQLCLVYN